MPPDVVGVAGPSAEGSAESAEGNDGAGSDCNRGGAAVWVGSGCIGVGGPSVPDVTGAPVQAPIKIGVASVAAIKYQKGLILPPKDSTPIISGQSIEAVHGHVDIFLQQAVDGGYHFLYGLGNDCGLFFGEPAQHVGNWVMPRGRWADSHSKPGEVLGF